jgi:hypothetical protein
MKPLHHIEPNLLVRHILTSTSALLSLWPITQQLLQYYEIDNVDVRASEMTKTTDEQEAVPNQ